MSKKEHRNIKFIPYSFWETIKWIGKHIILDFYYPFIFVIFFLFVTPVVTTLIIVVPSSWFYAFLYLFCFFVSLVIHQTVQIKQHKVENIGKLNEDGWREFEYDNLKIKTIHVPGHSPGHTAFIIEDIKENKRKILFASDIGITNRGAWYGYTYSHLKDIKESVKKLEKIYFDDDFIVASGHGPIIFDKKPEIFNDIIRRIDDIDNKLLSILDSNNPKSLDEIIYKGRFSSEDHTIQSKDDPLLSQKRLVSFFERNMITRHINDLIERKKIIQINNESWILNS